MEVDEKRNEIIIPTFHSHIPNMTLIYLNRELYLRKTSSTNDLVVGGINSSWRTLGFHGS